eukprot:223395_1
MAVPNNILLSKKEKNDSSDGEILSQQQVTEPTEPIILNIGGTKYQTTKLTLSCDTNSILKKMFDGRFLVQPNKDGSYFIDRDGTNFSYILNYLRNNKLNIPNDVYLIDHLILESEYYQLSSLKSELLRFKSNSKILEKGDIEFIQKCFDGDANFGTVNIQKSTLIYKGPGFPDYKKLKGSDSLLILVKSKNDRFGIYIDDNYIHNNVNGVNGKLLDFHSGISGQRCVHQQHKGGDDQKTWIWIQNNLHEIYDTDFISGNQHEVEIEACIEDGHNVEEWSVILEIGRTTEYTSYRTNAQESKPVSYIEIYQIAL